MAKRKAPRLKNLTVAIERDLVLKFRRVVKSRGRSQAWVVRGFVLRYIGKRPVSAKKIPSKS